jgi:hypothetical protein
MGASEHQPVNDAKPAMSRWQFSVRGMLLFTALVAAVLSVAVKLPDVFRVALIVIAAVSLLAAIMWTANFATSDTRPRLATISWLAFAAFFSAFATIGFQVAYESMMAGYELDVVAAGIVAVMSVCASLCFYRGGRAFVRARRSAANRPAAPHHDVMQKRQQ